MGNWVTDFLETSPLGAYPIAKRGNNALHFKGPQGHVAVLTCQPMHYQSAGGDWLALDTGLIADGSGGFGAPGLAARLLPNGMLKFAEKNLIYQAQGAGSFDSQTIAYSQIWEFPDGHRHEDRIIREGTGYRYEMRLTERGAKDELILDQMPAVSGGDYLMIESEVFSPLFAPGWKDQPLLAEGILFYPGEAIDAAGEQTVLERVVVNLSGPRYLVYTGVPLEWLESAQFPVVIDPTYSSQPDGSAGKDSYVFKDNGVWTNTNYGSETNLIMGNQVGNDFRRTLIQFDLSSIPLNSLVSNAELDLYQTSEIASLTRSFNVYRLTESWTEAGVSGTKRDGSADWSSVGGSYNGTSWGSKSLSSSEVNGHKVWPLNSAYMENFLNGSWNNYGWLIFANDTNEYNQHNFRSSDGATVSQRPKLVITYTPLNPQPSLFGGGLRLWDTAIGLYDTRIRLRAKERDTGLTTKVRDN